MSSQAFFNHRKPVKLLESEPPRLLVVVDTEEEFDWNSPPDPNQTSVGSMAHIDRVQSICSQYGIRPCYVIDYPVASQKTGYESLARYAAAGECEIGAHLHPWVNPPIREDITVRNMYPGNLDVELERAKLLKLRNTIESLTGQKPQVYKAGRYGFGPNTANLLAELGFTVDVSVSPPINHSGDGGPDHSWANSKPFWFGRQLLEVPTTGAFVGWAHPLGRPLFSMAQRLRRLKAPGVLARLSAVDRLMLSPEGFTSDEHIRLTRFLLKQGVRTFTWSFHSPSVEPGHTDYVKTEADLERFLASFTTYFDFFFNELGGVPTSPLQLRSYLETKQ